MHVRPSVFASGLPFSSQKFWFLKIFSLTVHLIPPSSSSTGGRRGARNGKQHPVNATVPLGQGQNVRTGPAGGTGTGPTGPGSIAQSKPASQSASSYGHQMHLAYEVKKLM